MRDEAVIVSAARTPIGRFGGVLAGVPATALGAVVLAAAVGRAGIDPGLVEDVLVGQVLQAGAGQNPARQSAIGAGLPDTVPAMTVNQVCGGGQRVLHLAAQAIRAGDAGIVLAGGQDSMSRAPHLLPAGRAGTRLGDAVLSDSLLVDGLVDAFNGVHMGVTAEHVARTRQVTRDEQDAFALGSQRKAATAVAEGRFDAEIVAVETAAGPVAADEHPRPGVTPEQLAALPAIFEEGGTVTAGNSSGLNDGAAAVLVMSERRAGALGLEPMARIVAYASAGLDPMLMGLGPVPAARRALALAGWSVEDLDLVELNEAFAAQAVAVNREMGWDPARVNVNGGAIALGHPLGGSGCRIVVTLVHEMARRGARRGLAAMCIGGGQGVAICLERDASGSNPSSPPSPGSSA